MDRETLEYYISSEGIEATMSLFHLTEQQIDNTLNGKALKENKTFTFKVKEYKEFSRSTSPDLEQLERVISENYSSLYKQFAKDKL